MALEDRVRVLEDEIRILKAQIRDTLLEIHEQILAHYYPDLRAREAPPSAAIGNERARVQPSLPAIQRVTLDEVEPGPTEAEPGGLRRASSTSLASFDPRDGATQTPKRPSLQQPESRESKSWATLTRLMEWANDSVGRIGRERTTKALEICAEGGYLDPDVKDALLQLIALSNEEAQVERVSLRAILDVLLRLNQVLGRETDIEEARWLMREVGVG
jgi:hypothetical protein